MSLLDLFQHKKRKNSACVARERLQIIVAHERAGRNSPDYLSAMKQDILTVIRKYVIVDNDDVNVHFDTRENVSFLELNVTLPKQKVGAK